MVVKLWLMFLDGLIVMLFIIFCIVVLFLVWKVCCCVRVLVVRLVMMSMRGIVSWYVCYECRVLKGLDK